MAHCGVGEQLQRRIILNVVVLDDAAMPVCRIFAEANIGDQKKIPNILANCAQRLLNDAVFIVAIRPDFVLRLR